MRLFCQEKQPQNPIIAGFLTLAIPLRPEQQKNKMEIKVNNVCAFGDSVMKGIVADKDKNSGIGLKYRISEMGFAERCRRSLNIGVDIHNIEERGKFITVKVIAVNIVCDCDKVNSVLSEHNFGIKTRLQIISTYS